MGGILRAPREKFPEHLLLNREVVAPRKCTRKGVPDEIPPDAKWTRIRRELVNPEALEAGKRFKAREGSIIILRVLSWVEIQGYANATNIIRGLFYLLI